MKKFLAIGGAVLALAAFVSTANAGGSDNFHDHVAEWRNQRNLQNWKNLSNALHGSDLRVGQPLACRSRVHGC